MPWRDMLRCEYVDCDRAHGRGDAVNTVATFSSLPPFEQFDAWHDAVSKAFVPLDATSRTEGAFGGVLANRAVGAVQISDVAGGAVDVYRSAQAIRRFDPGYLKLGMQLRGYCRVSAAWFPHSWSSWLTSSVATRSRPLSSSPAQC